jgi:predicted transcriptional regulator
MRKVLVQVENLDTGLERFKQAWETGEFQGEYVTFESLEGLMETLTPARWQLLRTLQTKGPMNLQSLALLMRRNVENVASDVAVLKDLALIEDTGKGSIWVPYDEIHLELSVSRAVA